MKILSNASHGLSHFNFEASYKHIFFVDFKIFIACLKINEIYQKNLWCE